MRLHRLSAQQVPGQQSVDWSGAAHHARLLSTRRPPQAGVLRHAPPQQLPSALGSSASCCAAVVVVPVRGVADGVSDSRACPANPSLVCARRGLPAAGSSERLALCKESGDVFFSSKLRQDGGVPEHAHVKGLLGFGSFVLGVVANDSVALCQVEVECDERAVLHAQCPQSRAVNLWGQIPKNQPAAGPGGAVCAPCGACGGGAAPALGQPHGGAGPGGGGLVVGEAGRGAAGGCAAAPRPCWDLPQLMGQRHLTVSDGAWRPGGLHL